MSRLQHAATPLLAGTALALTVALLAWWWAVPSGPRPAPPAAPPPLEQAPPPAPHLRPTPAPGPATEAGHPPVRENIVLPEGTPPKDDAEAWVDARATAEAQLRSSTLDAIDAWCDEAELSSEEARALSELVDTHHAALADIRAQLRNGRLSPAEFRLALGEEKEHTTEALDALLGLERADALRDRLAHLPGGIP